MNVSKSFYCNLLLWIFFIPLAFLASTISNCLFTNVFKFLSYIIGEHFRYLYSENFVPYLGIIKYNVITNFLSFLVLMSVAYGFAPRQRIGILISSILFTLLSIYGIFMSSILLINCSTNDIGSFLLITDLLKYITYLIFIWSVFYLAYGRWNESTRKTCAMYIISPAFFFLYYIYDMSWYILGIAVSLLLAIFMLNIFLADKISYSLAFKWGVLIPIYILIFKILCFIVTAIDVLMTSAYTYIKKNL